MKQKCGACEHCDLRKKLHKGLCSVDGKWHHENDNGCRWWVTLAN